MSELVVEICFPTDGSDPEQVAELEKEEMSENAGHAVRVSNLKEKVKHRGRKRLMTLKPVQITVDAVSPNYCYCHAGDISTHQPFHLLYRDLVISDYIGNIIDAIA